MSRYSINGQILTDIADSLRVRTGRTGLIEPENQEPIVWTSENVLYDNSGPYIETAFSNSKDIVKSFTIPGATAIRLKYIALRVGTLFAYAASGLHNVNKYGDLPDDKVMLSRIDDWYAGWNNATELVFENTDSVTLALYVAGKSKGGIYVEVYAQYPDVIKPEEMATIVTNLPKSPGKEELTFSDDISYLFMNGGFDWVTNNYGEMVTLKDVYKLSYAFGYSAAYPVNGIYCNNKMSGSGSYAFYAYKGTQLPMVHNFKPDAMDNMFAYMNYVTEFPEGYGEDWDFTYIDGLTSAYSGATYAMFQGCSSLRKIPMVLLQHGNPVVTNSYSMFNNMCNECYVLDELIDIPNTHWNAIYNSTSSYNNLFSGTVNKCCRLKDFTFASNFEVNGLPVKWANQVLDLTTVGYNTVGESYITNNSKYHGCTKDKFINSDEKYALLKDDPDATATHAKWSRYNKESAIRTINSLPDCSVYQTSNNQGANIIKFYGYSGANTDGGAINTLTDEEIAVAAAKGWTVTLV